MDSHTRLLNLPDGYWDLPPGRIAAVVTYLEMREPPTDAEPAQAPAGCEIHRVNKPDLDWYRELFRAVGQELLWFSRLRMSDAQLAAEIQSPGVEIYVVRMHGADKGILELDCRAASDVELVLFGVTPELTGKGVGAFMIAFAIRQAFACKPRRFHLHTCTLDHPRALAFYLKAGFTPYKRAIEISSDPRLTGELPRGAAPGIPLIG